MDRKKQLSQNRTRTEKNTPHYTWNKFRKYCRKEFRFGKLTVYIENGLPVYIEEVTEKVKFV